MSITILTEMSNRYGSAEFVLAGGGNTSFKDGNVMHVKSSGTELATITSDEFAAMDLEKLTAMLNAKYPDDDAGREAAALADVLAARLSDSQSKRPSVEALLHALFPYKYVLHTHPAIVNGLTCAKDGERACSELFGEEAVWLPLTKPGYILAKKCERVLSGRRTFPQILLLQNHGLFVAADEPAEIDTLMERVMRVLKNRAKTEPTFAATQCDNALAAEIAPALRMLYSLDGKAVCVFCANKLTDSFLTDEESFAPLTQPYSPDHIVYCKAHPLFIEPTDDYRTAFEQFFTENGYLPKIVAVRGLGFFALGKTAKEAYTARDFFLDAMKITVYSEAFGGSLTLPHDFTDFILNWEAESYRSGVSLSTVRPKRLQGKIAIVTGGAQGFGKGLARALVSEGAYVVIADLNAEGAAACASELNREFGKECASSVCSDVSNEESVKSMIVAAVLTFGGLDIMLSNAGILFAGSLPEMSLEKFMLVTKVNYSGYFLCAKYASVPMKIQRKYSRSYTADIIEINSKSGLEGSNKNFAYAGSKFGGIGLTQSFALELVEYGIKVNAICPGNLLDGPLWSDPEKGLFRQYLDAGKVPGAKTIADVRAFYEAKVPMRRGCTPEDVALAIFYIVEQQYETGQAIPVTGGQVMLS